MREVVGTELIAVYVCKALVGLNAFRREDKGLNVQRA
jgi:hypothetical protein